MDTTVHSQNGKAGTPSGPLPGPTLISSDLDHIIETFVKDDTMRISCDIVQLQYSERAHGSGRFGTNDLIIVSSTIL